MTLSTSSDEDPFALTKIERPIITKTYFYVNGAGNSPSKCYERSLVKTTNSFMLFIVDVCSVMQWLVMLCFIR